MRKPCYLLLEWLLMGSYEVKWGDVRDTRGVVTGVVAPGSW